MGKARHVQVDGGMSHGTSAAVRLGGEGYLFEPDVLTGQQWAGFHGQRWPDSGARRLMVAVLESAVDDLTTNRMSNDGHHPRVLREDARRWFLSEDRAWPMSFLNVCDVLGLEPEPIRRAILAAPPALPSRRHVAGEGNRCVREYGRGQVA